MLHAAYPIHTERLILRPFTADDLDDLYAYHSRPDVVRYLYWETRDRAQARQALADRAGKQVLDAEGQSIVLAVVWRENGRVVGEVNLAWLSRAHRQGEIGFVFNPEFQGRGLATEAAEVLLRLGFRELGLHRIIGRCDARNRPSAAALERLGMRREAHLVHNEIFKGEWSDEFVYALLDHEWLNRRPAAPRAARPPV
ncbi:GNAT family N-acetyltransferase [Amycolatopsis acidiphila]|uniref:GNAT family N-acetyltransferase n=1 Tax=Amycolatopsis acidiphila TaxID=715473 RepID=A0A558ALV0_9PSEU|nr:GNAT family N-acetyltransferase [Amycolatopsis acidiphila]TVT25238.1 GNAT family N-acetyltransferase [Amycolatopsis acidiphila]UIJ62354.1 GNAT family N-acetyltransferase [Amycolatopsis acidiphila]GHG83220.1 N-acetyltransferase [Amycolatopsis acidiphila]